MGTLLSHLSYGEELLPRAPCLLRTQPWSLPECPAWLPHPKGHTGLSWLDFGLIWPVFGPTSTAVPGHTRSSEVQSPRSLQTLAAQVMKVVSQGRINNMPRTWVRPGQMSLAFLTASWPDPGKTFVCVNGNSRLRCEPKDYTEPWRARACFPPLVKWKFSFQRLLI